MIKKQTMMVCATLSMASWLSGCGALWGDQAYFRDRDGDYQKADSIDPLKVPDGMNDAELGQLYIIPEIVETDFGDIPTEHKERVPRPDPIAANALAERVKIQRLGDERWVLMNVAPGELWPRVRSFLN